MHLPPGEGAFPPCTFWLADNHILAGRPEAARPVLDRVLAVRNNIGLPADEYSRPVGACSATSRRRCHTWPLSTPRSTWPARGPAQRRAGGSRRDAGSGPG